MGITPALWDDLRAPKPEMGGELGTHTQTYLDVYIALDCLHMRYPDYIRQTNSEERTLYALFLMLRNKKEEQAMKEAEARRKMDIEMERTASNGYRG